MHRNRLVSLVRVHNNAVEEWEKSIPVHAPDSNDILNLQELLVRLVSNIQSALYCRDPNGAAAWEDDEECKDEKQPQQEGSYRSLRACAQHEEEITQGRNNQFYDGQNV